MNPLESITIPPSWTEHRISLTLVWTENEYFYVLFEHPSVVKATLRHLFQHYKAIRDR